MFKIYGLVFNVWVLFIDFIVNAFAFVVSNLWFSI